MYRHRAYSHLLKLPCYWLLQAHLRVLQYVCVDHGMTEMNFA